jgi:hypothetical protein
VIHLGDFVRDELTGFTGVVLARTEGLYEATTCRVHPRERREDGGLREAYIFEEDRLTVIEETAVVGFRQVAGKESMQSGENK